MTYALHIGTAETNETLVDVRVANLSVITYASKAVEVGSDTEIKVTLTDNESNKVLVSITADAESAGDFLKGRLSKLRKAEKDSAPEYVSEYAPQ